MSKYVFFYGGIYSQWYQSPFTIDGIEYNCAEQYMMHQKALLFNDEVTAYAIMQEKDPRFQKQLGRQVEGFDKDKWDAHSRDVVYKGNLAKFSQNPILLDELLSTGDKIIVEASPTDTIWGIGMGMYSIGVENPANWNGLNWLGQAIMLVRNELRK